MGKVAVSASLRQLSKPDTMVSLGGDVTPAKGQASEGTVNTETVSVRCPLTERNIPDPEAKSKADELNVQIRASKSEIDRRISAFIERKQLEINENNVREFCNVIDCNQENSCARTDAVFTPFPGFKSHVKVTRVVNTYGPQTRSGASGEMKDQKRGVAPRDCGNPAVEERLHNIELHLKLPAEGPVPLSIYQRLKRLEDRILELEGLSPEYFQAMTYLHKRPKMANSQEGLTRLFATTEPLAELNTRTAINGAKAVIGTQSRSDGPSPPQHLSGTGSHLPPSWKCS
ncbi:hypothetical protein Z043_101128 [Scleropages formosus]|uniref:MAP3K12-binding inhibitory protein 1-like n=1 Tax=Scleropages formosus TaxID=113540 RepID=A0A0N8K319_SCLFO|nr:hypothetical protein Z043_101128 [Scleropages formosus]